MTAREVLINLSLYKNGDWGDIYHMILKREKAPNVVEEGELGKFNCVTLIDPRYPVCLRYVGCPPFTLFYKGDISLLERLDKYGLGIVGSREYSQYAKSALNDIFTNLSKDLIIISGMAKGIDRLAHEYAIKNGIKTVAILGSGINHIYPKQNEDIYNKIIENGGLIISEYPLNTEPTKSSFLVRNRIIAGLSKTLFLVESNGPRSGAYYTARYALSIGKNVACLPYHANEASNCNALIKDGAYLVEDSQDINSLFIN